MPLPLPTTGFFDNLSEAQQAVQQLLSGGFAHETIRLTTPPPNPTTDAEQANSSPTMADSTGRFFFSLFGNLDETGTEATHQTKASVTVYAPSVAEAARATDLLTRAGALMA